jgi:hypothetical protein
MKSSQRTPIHFWSSASPPNQLLDHREPPRVFSAGGFFVSGAVLELHNGKSEGTAASRTS